MPYRLLPLLLGLSVFYATTPGCTPIHSTSKETQSPVAQTKLSRKLHALAADTTITVAHRGDSGNFPENCLPAFESAVSKAAEMVELDFHQTADQQLVCIHDATLDRTTDSRQRLGQTNLKVAKLSISKLQELDAGTWKHQKFAGTRIPTLEAALATIQAGSVTMIEHKAGDAQTLVTLLRKLNLIHDVLVQSFHWSFLEQVHALEPQITLAALGGSKKYPTPTGEALDRIERTHSSMVHWSFKRLTKEHVTELHKRGYLVCVYTLDRVEDFEKAISMGVDAITTNRPSRLRRHLKQR